MPNLKATGELPSWVQIVVRNRTRRQAKLMAVLFGILGVLSLSDAALVVIFGSVSVLGRIALAIQSPAGCLFVGAALWFWLAVRWVDRAGQWVQ